MNYYMNDHYKLVTVLGGFQPSGKPKVYERQCPGMPIHGATLMIDKDFGIRPANYDVRQPIDGGVIVVAMLYGRTDEKDWHEVLPAHGFNSAHRGTLVYLGLDGKV